MSRPEGPEEQVEPEREEERVRRVAELDAAVVDGPLGDGQEPATEERGASPEPEPVQVEPEPPPPVYVEPTPPPAAEPPPRIHEAAAKQLHEEPLAEIERNYVAPQQAPEPQRSAFDEEEYPFGKPEIPMPAPAPRPGDR